LRAIKERVKITGNEVEDKDNGAHIGSREWSSGLTRGPDTGGDAVNQRIEMAPEKSDLSAGLRAMESSIRVFPRPPSFKYDQFVGDRALVRGRTSRTLVLFFVAALIGVGATFAWHSQGDEAKGMFRRWALSLDWLSSVSTTKSTPAPAAASTSPELVQPLEAVAPDLVAARHSAEQPAAEQKQMYPDVATAEGRAEHQIENVIAASAFSGETHSSAGDGTDNH
jgi:hypothetical protein